MNKTLQIKTKLPAGLAYITTSNGIKDFKLRSNDLRILLKQNVTVPTVTVMVTYHVGSRNEVLGNTGATHILEHMLFKGSRNFNKKNGKEHAVYLQKMGGRVNATTWLDRTNYYQTLPRAYLEEAIALEADRMRFAFIKDADLKTEMPVVLNEFERGENDPTEALDKQMWATAFHMHPYHHSTIGWREDIETTNAKKLKAFYDTFYYPNNATLTVIGDYDEYALLSYIKKYFGEHKRAPHNISQKMGVEPRQEGVRRVEVKRPGETNIVGVGFKIPSARDGDTHAIHLLAGILGVGSSSRLSRRLVDSGLCSRIYIMSGLFHDENILIIYAYTTKNVTHSDVEKIIIEEIELIKSKGVTDGELQRVKEKTKAEMAWSRDGSFNVAGAINEAIALGDWTFYGDYFKKTQRVTTSDILRVTKKYFIENQSTIGYFIGQSEKIDK